jgi:hypothetical protein
MSAVTRFMTTATAIPDEQDRQAIKQQPPFFVRTTWLFGELEELALPEEAETFKAIKVARLSGDITPISKLVDQLVSNTEPIADGRQRHERRQLCAWIKEQIEREPKL